MDPVLKETRGEIVNLLKTRQGVSASELAEELSLHSMTIRQHLAILESNGYIQRTKVKSNRGRPKFFYHLTEKAKENIAPRNYPKFAVELLDIVESIDGSAFVPKARIIFPLTLTDPLEISSSALRLEAKPACAIIF